MVVRSAWRALLVAAAVVAGQGCGPAQPGSGAAPTSSPTPSQASQAAASEDPLPCVPGVDPFTGPAAEEFGADRVMAAYCDLVELSLGPGLTSLVVPAQGRTAADYDVVRTHLTPTARRRWRALVREYLATGDPDAWARINALTVHDVRDVPRGYEIPVTGPYFFGSAAGPATAQVERAGGGEPRLVLALTVETGIVLEETGAAGGRHSLLPLTRELRYELVPGDGDRWWVDAWGATWRTGRVRLVSG